MPELVHMDEDTLTHYGRLGMKWGQHIFGRDRMGANITRRLGRYERRSDRYAVKSARAEKKHARYAHRGNMQKALKYEGKAAKYNLKSAKVIRRGHRFARNANGVFGTDPVSGLSPEQIAIGQRYALQFVKKGG